MAKLATLTALLVGLLASAEASTTYRTTITTTTEEDFFNPRARESEQRCQEQIQRQKQQLRECERYLSQGKPYDQLSLRMVTNPQPQTLRQCCSQLQNLDEGCVCAAIREMVRDQQQVGERGRRETEMREMEQKARYLPRQCNIAPGECQI